MTSPTPGLWQHAVVVHVSVQAALLRRARDLAGGVSLLARVLQVSANELDDMLHGKTPIPTWLFLRGVDYVNEVEQAGIGAPTVGAANGIAFEDLLVNRSR
jgi:hypothetical protein